MKTLDGVRGWVGGSEILFFLRFATSSPNGYHRSFGEIAADPSQVRKKKMLALTNAILSCRTRSNAIPYIQQSVLFCYPLPTNPGQTPHQCDVCGKKYTRKEHLANHMRSHTNETPFRCEICGKSFSRKEHFTNHILWHTGKETKRIVSPLPGSRSTIDPAQSRPQANGSSGHSPRHTKYLLYTDTWRRNNELSLGLGCKLAAVHCPLQIS